ncbi:hypothetical protein GCM10009795_028090 [Nocardioides hankookensis]
MPGVAAIRLLRAVALGCPGGGRGERHEQADEQDGQGTKQTHLELPSDPGHQRDETSNLDAATDGDNLCRVWAPTERAGDLWEGALPMLRSTPC